MAPGPTRANASGETATIPRMKWLQWLYNLVSNACSALLWYIAASAPCWNRSPTLRRRWRPNCPQTSPSRWRSEVAPSATAVSTYHPHHHHHHVQLRSQKRGRDSCPVRGLHPSAVPRSACLSATAPDEPSPPVINDDTITNNMVSTNPTEQIS